MDPDGDSPPFWSQPNAATFFLPHRHHHRRQPSPIFNPVALILAVPILILLIIFFLVPPFLSHTTQILRPNSVKKSWDSLNILLVLFAILCGVFLKRNDEASSSSDAADQRNLNFSQISDFSTPPPPPPPATTRGLGSSSQWYGFSDGKEYGANVSDCGGTRLRRSSSSYPDLRQESLWENLENRFRFYDDFEVKSYRPSPVAEYFHRPQRWNEAERGEPETSPVKVIPVDKYEVHASRSPPPTPPKSPAPPPPPPPPAVSLKRRRSFHSVPKKEKFERWRNGDEFQENQSPAPPPPPSTPPPPPPPPPPPAAKPQSPQVKTEMIHRKKSGTTKEIATAIASLYRGQRKRKKKVKTRNIYESASSENSSSPEQYRAPAPAPAAPPPPPPPPPLPPPSKVLQNLFKKSIKNKRVHSVSNTAPPPPPPPPPPNSIFNNIFKSKRFHSSSAAAPQPPPPPPPPPASILNSLFKHGTKSRRFKNISTQSPPPAPPPPPPQEIRRVNTGKPPKPNKTTSYNETVIIAPPSPLIPMPPPPPPFKMKATKFVARGDFIKISSAQSSQCSSPPPELEDFDVMSVKSDGGDPIGPSVSCPSPDVNAKADTFIARRRDEWRLDKMNSMKEKRKLG